MSFSVIFAIACGNRPDMYGNPSRYRNTKQENRQRYRFRSSYSKDYAKAHVPMAPVVWHRSSLALAMFISGIIMIGTATPALAMLGTTTPVHLFFIAILTIFSLLIVLFASLLPWHTKFAPVIIKTVTLYLVMLLITAICFVA